LSEERLPVSETVKVLKSITIYKTDNWWSAVVIAESFGRKQIATYLWNKKSGVWKRRQKLVIHSKDEWNKIKEAVEGLIAQLP
jgi:hypothetical protein